MDYKKRYDRLIETRQARQLESTLEGYRERHHIVPRCMGGSDDPSNLVELTPEEHFTAHLLLMMIYPENSDLVYACHMMTVGVERSNNKLVGWAKRKFARAVSILTSERLTGSRWATNGPERRQLHRDESLPDGWWYGGAPATGWRRATDGVEMRMLCLTDNEQLPEGWAIAGAAKNTRWATNGVERRILLEGESLPEDWWYGGAPAKDRKHITDGINSKMHDMGQPVPEGWFLGGAPAKDRKHITDGTDSKMHDMSEPIPEGWSEGRTFVNLKPEPAPIVVKRNNMSASKRLQKLKACDLTEDLWSEMAAAYSHARRTLSRKSAVSVAHKQVASRCKVSCCQVFCYTRLPFLQMTMQEYIDEYCTQTPKTG